MSSLTNSRPASVTTAEYRSQAGLLVHLIKQSDCFWDSEMPLNNVVVHHAYAAARAGVPQASLAWCCIMMCTQALPLQTLKPVLEQNQCEHILQ